MSLACALQMQVGAMEIYKIGKAGRQTEGTVSEKIQRRGEDVRVGREREEPLKSTFQSGTFHVNWRGGNGLLVSVKKSENWSTRTWNVRQSNHGRRVNGSPSHEER